MRIYYDKNIYDEMISIISDNGHDIHRRNNIPWITYSLNRDKHITFNDDEVHRIGLRNDGTKNYFVDEHNIIVMFPTISVGGGHNFSQLHKLPLEKQQEILDVIKKEIAFKKTF